MPRSVRKPLWPPRTAKKIQTTTRPMAAPISGRSTKRRASDSRRTRERGSAMVTRRSPWERRRGARLDRPRARVSVVPASVYAALHQLHDLVDIVLGDEEAAIVDDALRAARQHAVADVG